MDLKESEREGRQFLGKTICNFSPVILICKMCNSFREIDLMYSNKAQLFVKLIMKTSWFFKVAEIYMPEPRVEVTIAKMVLTSKLPFWAFWRHLL